MKRYQVLLTDEQEQYINKIKNELLMSDSQAIRTLLAKSINSDYQPEIVFVKYGKAVSKFFNETKHINNNLHQIIHSLNILLNMDSSTQEKLHENKQLLANIKKLDTELSIFLENLKKRLL